jgi:dTMP kinase
LYKYLLLKGWKVLLTREPGGTEVGKKIRDILLMGNEKIGMYTELFLYLADRAENLVKIVLPNLNKGKIIISDRHFDSTIAYQMAGRGIKEEEMMRVKGIKLFSDREPDVTFLLDVDPEIVKDRIKNPDRIEKENIDFHRRVRQSYLKLAEENPDRIVRVDSRGTVDEIHEMIKKEISSFLEEDFNEHEKEI